MLKDTAKFVVINWNHQLTNPWFYWLSSTQYYDKREILFKYFKITNTIKLMILSYKILNPNESKIGVNIKNI